MFYTELTIICYLHQVGGGSAMLKRSREELRRLDEERFGWRRECRHSGEFEGLHIQDDFTVYIMHACSCFTGITLTYDVFMTLRMYSMHVCMYV